jgi:hypothetical protein
MSKAVHDRLSHRGGRALSSIGKSGIHYLPLDSIQAHGGTPKVRAWTRQWFLKLTRTDQKTGLKRFVTVDLGQTSVTLTRTTYAKFEADVLKASKKLEHKLSRYHDKARPKAKWEILRPEEMRGRPRLET